MLIPKSTGCAEKLGILVLAFGLSSWSTMAFASHHEEVKSTNHTAQSEVYELRTYTTNEGKLPALHGRFRQHTMTFFAKHGMRNIAYWIPENTPNTLIYIIAHESRDAADSNWQGFVNDPDWQKVYAASIADGRLVKNIDSVFMSKTDYSP